MLFLLLIVATLKNSGDYHECIISVEIPGDRTTHLDFRPGHIRVIYLHLESDILEQLLRDVFVRRIIN